MNRLCYRLRCYRKVDPKITHLGKGFCSDECVEIHTEEIKQHPLPYETKRTAVHAAAVPVQTNYSGID